jgi:ketosteroid isomerase-like protein
MIKNTISFLLLIMTISSCNNSDKSKAQITNNMSNKKVIETYMDGFRESDHTKILSCLTDSIVWEMPGLFHLVGKEQFDKEIENPAFTGSPIITIKRLVEEGNIVVAEGNIIGKFKNGGTLDASFCDVFHFENNKISRLTGYLMQNKQP